MTEPLVEIEPGVRRWQVEKTVSGLRTLAVALEGVPLDAKVYLTEAENYYLVKVELLD